MKLVVFLKLSSLMNLGWDGADGAAGWSLGSAQDFVALLCSCDPWFGPREQRRDDYTGVTTLVVHNSGKPVRTNRQLTPLCGACL